MNDHFAASVWVFILCGVISYCKQTVQDWTRHNIIHFRPINLAEGLVAKTTIPECRLDGPLCCPGQSIVKPNLSSPA